MRRALTTSLALLCLAGAAGWQAAASGPEDPAVVGRWLHPFSEDGDGDGIGDFDVRPPATRSQSARLPTAVNAAVLPDGRVLYWSQLEGSESVDQSIAWQQPNRRSRSRVLDLASYLATGARPSPLAFSAPSPEDAGAGDMIGSEQRQLPDGRVLAIGGNEWSNDNAGTGVPLGRTELYGSRSARIFDPASDAWTPVAPMAHRRYYPSLVTLSDGRMLAMSGASRLIYNSSLVPGAHAGADVLPQNVTDLEIFDAASGTWTHGDPGSRVETVLFPHLRLLPDGSLLHPAAGMIFPPGGGDAEMREWTLRRTFDPLTGRWTTAGVSEVGVRGNAFSVLQPLVPPYTAAQVVVGGGTIGTWPGSHLATPVVQTVAWTAADGVAPVALPGAPLPSGRWHSSAVALPTGEIVVVNGADRDEVVDPGGGFAVRNADLYDPATGAWRRGAAGARDRTLHSTAVLLRDGSVLVGGHSPAPAHYGSHQANNAPFSHNLKDPSFEIYQPPYLFRGPRPTMTALPQAPLQPGGTFTIATPDAADPTVRAVLVRLPSITHGIDNDQRTVVLAARPLDGATLRAQVPSSAVVPPGHYYLFLTTDDGQGPTPSVAEIVRVA